MLAAYYGTKPPAAEPSDAPAGKFSAARAMEHVDRIGRQAHPIGSPENAEVRQYIFDRLGSLGLDPRVQTATVVNEQFGFPYAAGTPTNVLARIRGTQGGEGGRRAVMLVAHYDSVAGGPGANDDGTAVATLLETARALSSGPPPRNDVIVLFTDGEETGLLGAKAFVEEHPWADDVGVVLNFEARGSGGPSAVFEITPNAREWRLVEGVARAAPRPIASSASAAIYSRMSVNTDLSVFRYDAGMSGLNFGYFGDATTYHTALDTPANVDEDSLQHHGSYALALARYFGEAGPEEMAPRASALGKPVYFDVLGLFLVSYPAGWAVVISVFVVVAFAGVVVFGLRRRLLTVRGTVGSFLASLLALVLIPAVVAALLPLVRFVGGGRPEDISRGDVYHSGIFALGLLTATLALAIAVYGFVGRRAGAHNLTVGSLVPWLLLCVLSTAFVPRVSYVFTWPVLLVLVGLAASFVLPDGRGASRASYLRAAILLLSAAAAIALLAPSVYLLYLALTVRLAAVTAVLVVLGVGLLAGPVTLVGGEGTRETVGTSPAGTSPAWASPSWASPAWAAVGLAFATAGLFASGVMLSGFDADHPRPDSILYALDADSGEARWATFDERDDYTSRFVGPNAERGSLGDFLPLGPPGLSDQAPAVPLAAPAVEVLGDETSGNERTLRLRASSPRGAENLSLWLESDGSRELDTPVLSAAVDGEPAGQTARLRSQGLWGIEFHNLPEDGVEITLKVRAAAPLRLRAVDYSDGLPDVPGIDEARPADTMPAYDERIRNASFGDATFVGKSFDLSRNGAEGRKAGLQRSSGLRSGAIPPRPGLAPAPSSWFYAPKGE